ncbi:hypothetical protein BJ138DRAFT_269644 [Hygrophoropsis aurantiaca]|uniref:Uncharacterized protein n=1 Tax=Hygrophoropsis aurantiaca TaxID=72124 RepID=A0ACB8AN03_9AGAM|nr:hypothetical protein BJ138DRAFT_269644 [Hygrophoropsis aurantiaca]
MSSPTNATSDVAAVVSRLGFTLESLQQSVQDSQDHQYQRSEKLQEEVLDIRAQLNRLERMMSTILGRLPVPSATINNAQQSESGSKPQSAGDAPQPDSEPISQSTSQSEPSSQPSSKSTEKHEASTSASAPSDEMPQRTPGAQAIRLDESNPWIAPESWIRRSGPIRRQGAFYGVPDWNAMQNVSSCNDASVISPVIRRKNPHYNETVPPPPNEPSAPRLLRSKTRPLRREGAMVIPGSPLRAVRRSASPEPSTRESSCFSSLARSPSPSPSKLESLVEHLDVEEILDAVSSDFSESEYFIPHDGDSGYADTEFGASSGASDGDVSDGDRSDYSDGGASISSRKRSREPEDGQPAAASPNSSTETSSFIHNSPVVDSSAVPLSSSVPPSATPVPEVDDGACSDGSFKRRKLSMNKESASTSNRSPRTTGSRSRKSHRSSTPYPSA